VNFLYCGAETGSNYRLEGWGGGGSRGGGGEVCREQGRGEEEV
jgi:hypothetical protein